MASEIRVDKINSLSGVGTVTLSPTGVDIAGITTAATLRATTGIVTSLTAVSSAKVGSGVTLSPDGDIFATGVTTATTFSGSGASLTNLNASNIASGTVPTARLGSGTASSSTFLRGDSSFQTITTDLVGDTSPQLGGNLDVNTKNITFGDSAGSSDDRLTFGAGTDLSIYHDDSNSRSRIEHSTDNALEILQGGNAGMLIQNQNSYNIEIKTNAEDAIKCVANGAVELYHNNVKKLETESNGSTVTGRFRVQDSGNVDLAITDTSTNAVAAYIGVKTAGYVEYNCYKSGVGTKYPHVFYGYTEEYARIDSAGIKFNGDTATANALDDYEEGSFDATCANSVTLHSGVNRCSYTKIGRVVTVRGQVRINNDNGTSDFVINNLPFTNADADGEDSSLSVGAVRLWDFNVTSDTVNVICLVVGENTELQFWVNKDNASSERLDADSNAYIAFTVTYFAV